MITIETKTYDDRVILPNALLQVNYPSLKDVVVTCDVLILDSNNNYNLIEGMAFLDHFKFLMDTQKLVLQHPTTFA